MDPQLFRAPGIPGTLTDNSIPRYSSSTFRFVDSALLDDGATITAARTIILRTGAALPGMAPMKLVSGPLLSLAEVGAIEFLTNVLYFTGGAGRQSIPLAPPDGPITFKGTTAARQVDLPDANIQVARIDAAQTFIGVQTFSSPIVADLTNCTFPTLNQNTTGSAGSLKSPATTGLLTATGMGAGTTRAKTVRDADDTILELSGSYTPTGTWTSLTMVTPVLGTPTSGNLVNCTGYTFASLASKPTTIAGYGITDFNSLGDARWQPLDSDLTAIAALATDSFGRDLLIKTSAASVRTYIGAGTSSFDGTFTSLTGKPTTIAGYGITDFNSLGDARWQALDSDLTSWAAITRASGFDTFTATSTSANLALLITDETGSGLAVFNNTPTLTTPVINGLITGTGQATAATASTIVMRDSNANLSTNNALEGYSTQATANSTLTLTVSSPRQIFFTGTTSGQILKMPVTSTLVLGQAWLVVNKSTQTVSIQSSGSGVINQIGAGNSAIITCILTSGTTAASWSNVDLPSTTFLSGTYLPLAGGTMAGQLVLMTGDGDNGAPLNIPPGTLTLLSTNAGDIEFDGTDFYGTVSGVRYYFLQGGRKLGTPTSGTLTNCTFPTLNQNTTGSAATLSPGRSINGVSFNGGSNITVTADASTLTGATLASGVTASSLTSLGTLVTQLLPRTGAAGLGTAPIRLTSGTLNSSPLSGSIEFLTDVLYFVISTGPTRMSVPLGPATGPITFAGPTAARIITFPDAAITVARTDSAQTFTGVQTFVAPILGTPTSGTLTNCTFPTLNQDTTGSAGSLKSVATTGLLTVTGMATGTTRAKTVRDANDTILELGGSYTPTGTWTSLTMVTPVLGTPTSGTLTNCTFPTLNQSSTGSAGSLKSPSTTGLLTATGMGAGTTRAKTVRDADDTILELGGSYTPTGTWTSLTLTTPAIGAATGTSLVLSSFINEAKGADIASATTTDIGAMTGNYGDVTGTTTITGLGTIQAGTRRVVRFTGALTLTYNATSLILPGATDITTVAGDVGQFISLGSGNWRMTGWLPATVTGSGAAVFATSPTFVTPRLGTPASGVLTSCTFPTLNQNTTGSAAKLTATVKINGVDFDGSANITVTAAAGTLSGATLASGVTASSLTSFGGSPTMTGTLTVPLLSITGTSTPQVLIAPASGAISFIGRIPTTGDYAQFGFQNPAASQRGFFGYIGSTFGGSRSDHFEVGTTTSTHIYFRPGDTGNTFVMQSDGHMVIEGVTSTGATGTGKFVFDTTPTFNGVTLAAGSTSVSPLKFTSGTNLTTPTAGSVEYDGTIWTVTPDATVKRALALNAHYYRNNAAVTVANNNTATAIFTTATVAIKASTTYEFEMVFTHVNTNTTSHTEGLRFTLAGSASVTDFSYHATRSLNSVTVTGVSSIWGTAATATVMTPALTTSQNTNWIVKGTFRVNAGGTIQPEFIYSAAPGGTGTIAAGAYIKLIPLGAAGADINIGAWV